jgi:hypothetical protein
MGRGVGSTMFELSVRVMICGGRVMTATSDKQAFEWRNGVAPSTAPTIQNSVAAALEKCRGRDPAAPWTALARTSRTLRRRPAC